MLLVIAAAFTSFYSWRLIFMTFHGKPRASHDVMHHVHESPPVMLVPLFILAAGALFAGVVFHDYFIGEDYAGVLEGGAVHAAGQPHPARDPPRAALGEAGAVRRDGARLPARLPVLHPLAGDAEATSPRSTAASTQFLLNKWYFDELYDFLFVRPAKRLGRFLWKKGDGWLIDGFGPDGVSARVIDVTNRVVKLQTGYLYHYAFAMLIGVAALVTWMMFGSSLLMTGWPILSTVTFLPLVGVLLILFIRDESESALRNIRTIALWTTVVHLRGVAVRSGSASTMPIPASSWSRRSTGWAPASPTTWASTASRCCSSS